MKKSSQLLMLSLALLLSFPCFSATYSFKDDPSQEKFEDIAILKKRTLTLDKKEFDLKLVNYGLRKKAVFGLVPVRIYTLQLLAAQPDKLVKTPEGILESLKAGSPVQIYLTLLRDIPGKKISDSFRDSLAANKINLKEASPELKQVLTEIDSIDEFKNKENFSLTAVWDDKADQGTLLIEDPTQAIKSITGNAQFLNQFFSIWFGKTTDSRLEDLKKSLLK